MKRQINQVEKWKWAANFCCYFLFSFRASDTKTKLMFRKHLFLFIVILLSWKSFNFHFKKPKHTHTKKWKRNEMKKKVQAIIAQCENISITFHEMERDRKMTGTNGHKKKIWKKEMRLNIKITKKIKETKQQKRRRSRRRRKKVTNF